MSTPFTRRRFVQSAAAGGAILGLGDLTFLARLPKVSAAEARIDPQQLRPQSDIESLVRLLEETPRQRLLEEVGARIRRGTSYREVLAALLLAGVRNVQPRPNVGFKFHAVLVVNSAHLASLSSPDEHRWLPIFWALDYFKDAQAQEAAQSGWHLGPVEESAVASADKASAAFIAAMESWDEPAADAAIVALARTAAANEVYELLFSFGCRDFRDIGHKAIFVANSFRTLNCIGWQYAEPVLRSLTLALLKRDSENPAKSDLAADRPGRRNQTLAAKFRTDWRQGRIDDAATNEMLATLRQGSDEDTCNKVVELINRGVSPQSIWDALLVGAGELLARKPGITSLHSVTSSNALHFAYQTAGDDQTRRMLMLQNAAFLPLFREAMRGRGTLPEFRLDQLVPTALSTADKSALDEIFTDVGGNRPAAASKVLAYLKDHPDAKDLIDAARVLVFLKGRDSHDYKFSSAVLEDYYHVSPAWRDRFLAASVFNLRGSGGPDNQVVQRTRAALQG